jgi:hypothetical protein
MGMETTVMMVAFFKFAITAYKKSMRTRMGGLKAWCSREFIRRRRKSIAKCAITLKIESSVRLMCGALT